MSLHCQTYRPPEAPNAPAPRACAGRRPRRGERGQIIVIAIAVMFLLAFIAGLFLTLITRNMARTSRGQNVVQATYLAEAGIRYADQQLTYGMLGADWRPEPDLNPNPADPDYDYLKAGYTRFNQGNGRFLLRVSYMPIQTDANGQPVDADGKPTSDPGQMVYPPLDKYIKIESVGRRGVVDPEDPTTWRNADPLRRQLVAYKPIGITDYVRFVTNKDRSDNTMVLGSYPFSTVAPYDKPAANEQDMFRTTFYGPVRVNGDLMWSGLDTIFLNSAEKKNDTTPERLYQPSLGLFDVNRQDTVAVAGRIFHDAWPFGKAPADQVRLADANGNTQDVLPSDDPNFTTVNGAYRDALPGQTTGEGKVRGVARLEPPAMDAAEPSTGILRYRLLTRNTGTVPDGKNFNTGQYGLGMGIYVDNGNEIQHDNRWRRLTDEWAQTGTGRESESYPGSAWRQNLYTPPGAEVYLDPTPNANLNTAFPAGQSQGTIFITRHDGKPWRDEDGRPEGFTRRYRYPLRRVFDKTGALVDSETYNEAQPLDPYRDATGSYKTFQNGVMFFEGNVRIAGKLPADWKSPSGQVVGQHLTIVTMGTAYIEGNLLKGDAASGNVNGLGAGVQLGTITVIAKDYVAVNATAYFMKQPESGPWNFSQGNPYTELASAGDIFRTSGYSAVDPAAYQPSARGAQQEMLLLQTAESYSGAAADFLVSAHRKGPNDGFVDGSPFPAGQPMVVTPGQTSLAVAEAIWEHRELPLFMTNADLTSWSAAAGPLADWFTLTYRPYYDQNPQYNYTPGGAEYGQAYNKPLWLSRMAIDPLDIRIEAVMYAQDGSFYVIPGEWLNSNPADERGPTPLGSLRYSDPVGAGWRVQDVKDRNGNNVPSLYPFFAEPPDIRVVINGAVAENIPADPDYQTAWSRHWGWTPRVRADGTDSEHGGEGLVYMYDNTLRLPVRYDQYNRPLPPAPALPVSPDLVYFGEAS